MVTKLKLAGKISLSILIVATMTLVAFLTAMFVALGTGQYDIEFLGREADPTTLLGYVILVLPTLFMLAGSSALVHQFFWTRTDDEANELA